MRGVIGIPGGLPEPSDCVDERGFDGASHHHAVICAGLRGHVSTRHGARDRWDWGRTLATLERAQDRHGRLQALADSLTPEQRVAVWSDDSEQARLLRRFVR